MRCDRGTQTFGAMQRFVFVGDLGHDQEFFAAPAHAEVALTQLRADQFGHAFEHVIARGMAVEIVDLFELVDVYDDQRQSSLHPVPHATAEQLFGRNPQTNEALFVSSLEFTADQDSVALFACGWFAYLALAAAANAFTRAQAATVAKGLAIVTAMNVLSLAAFAYINGYGSVINGPGGGGYLWLLKYVYHLIYLVAPFAGPFGVALLLHPRWRAGFGFLAEGRAPAGRAQRVTA